MSQSQGLKEQRGTGWSSKGERAEQAGHRTQVSQLLLPKLSPSHVIPHTVFRQSEEETQTSWILHGGGQGREQEVCLFLAVQYLKGHTPTSVQALG